MIAILEIFPLQNVTRHRNKKQSHQRSNHSYKNRYTISLD